MTIHELNFASTPDPGGPRLTGRRNIAGTHIYSFESDGETGHVINAAMRVQADAARDDLGVDEVIWHESSTGWAYIWDGSRWKQDARALMIIDSMVPMAERTPLRIPEAESSVDGTFTPDGETDAESTDDYGFESPASELWAVVITHLPEQPTREAFDRCLNVQELKGVPVEEREWFWPSSKRVYKSRSGARERLALFTEAGAEGHLVRARPQWEPVESKDSTIARLRARVAELEGR